MDSRRDMTVTAELHAATETSSMPAVPAPRESADAAQRRAARRSSLAVSLSLLTAFVAVTLVSF